MKKTILLLLNLFVLTILFGCGAKEDMTINPEKYFSVSYHGANGKGKVLIAQVDTDKLAADVNLASDIFKDMNYYIFDENGKHIKKDEQVLKNNQKLTFEYSIENKDHSYIKFSPFTSIVTGLKSSDEVEKEVKENQEKIELEKKKEKNIEKEKRQKFLDSFKNKPNYKKIMRNSDKYKGNKYKFKAEVMQVMDDVDDENDIVSVLVWIDGDTDKLALLTFYDDKYKTKILEKDILNVRAYSNLTYRYETVKGSNNEVPNFQVETYSIKE